MWLEMLPLLQPRRLAHTEAVALSLLNAF